MVKINRKDSKERTLLRNSTLMFDKFHGINLQAVIHQQLGNFHMAINSVHGNWGFGFCNWGLGFARYDLHEPSQD